MNNSTTTGISQAGGVSNSLFSSGEEWQSNACVNYSHAPMRLYILGYKKAGDILAQQVIETARDQDSLVYPIAFLYRQYIELQLKDIIKESRILLSEGSTFPEHHKLKTLWELVSQLMRKVIAKADESAGKYITSEDFAFVETVVSSFVEIDPESMAFRYPKNKHGCSSLGEIRHINIHNLAEQINELSERLEKFDLVVGVLRDGQNEMPNL